MPPSLSKILTINIHGLQSPWISFDLPLGVPGRLIRPNFHLFLSNGINSSARMWCFQKFKMSVSVRKKSTCFLFYTDFDANMPRKHASCKWSVNMQQVYELSIIVVALQNVWMSYTLLVNVSCIEIEIHELLDDSTFLKAVFLIWKRDFSKIFT